MTPPKPDFLEILRVLQAHEVRFIVVGGVSGVLQGAPIATFDLDLVHDRTAENVGKLIQALEKMGARYRGQAERNIKPDGAHLQSPGHQLLMTDHGPLDLLGEVGERRGYADLLHHTVEMNVGGSPLRVLDLDTLIELKAKLARDKDKAVLAILRRVRDEKQRT